MRLRVGQLGQFHVIVGVARIIAPEAALFVGERAYSAHHRPISTCDRDTVACRVACSTPRGEVGLKLCEPGIEADTRLGICVVEEEFHTTLRVFGRPTKRKDANG
eukprot:scaffold11091_cov75-Phaeocystis_antarctica.AAC.8